MNKGAVIAAAVPGVSFQSRRREPEVPWSRTDVAGFIGFESRVRDGGCTSRLTGGPPPVGHEFTVALAACYVQINGQRCRVPATADLVLSADPATIPLHDGENLIYAVVAGEADNGEVILVSVAGEVRPADRQAPPADSRIESRVQDLVRDGTTPSQLTGGPPPVGHEFRVDIAPFHIALGTKVVSVPGIQDLVVSAAADAMPLAPGQSLVYSLAVTWLAGLPGVVAVRGKPAATGRELPPTEAQVRYQLRQVVGGQPFVRFANLRFARQDNTIRLTVDRRDWLRLADVRLVRAGDAVRLTVIPRLPPSRCDDLQDFYLAFGPPQDDGTLLAQAVWAFFANGGRRVWITTVRRPHFEDAAGLAAALEEMIGQPGSSEAEATGLERLLLLDEVSIVDVPDLYARSVSAAPEVFNLPGTTAAAGFQDCRKMIPGLGEVAEGWANPGAPLYDDTQVWSCQTRMLRRLQGERWRVFLLLNVPLDYDAGSGQWRPPGPARAKEWRQAFLDLGEDPEQMSGAALYYPWVISRQGVTAPLEVLPPTAFVAGVMARRDLARGPQVAPANETLAGVVGLSYPVDDPTNGELYENPYNINVLRSFPGYGIQIWGARTFSPDIWLRYVSVRRTLSAIERRALAALQPLVFEPHTPMLWLQVTQQLLDILFPFFQGGSLRGSRPEEAFYVRCDASVNPPEEVAAGRLVVEVGVAIAAPAEFLIFRLSRQEGNVTVVE